MLEKIYSVFVSSTYEDLREERAEVQRALLMAKCFPIGMEAFPSTDEETWEFIKRQIEDADFYLLVVAGRYGSTDEQGLSFTEKEYDYAREIRKPTLAFVHSDRGTIAASKTDQDNAKRKSLDAFIKKIQSGPMVSRYATHHELRAQVLLSITNLKETNKTAVGFVRGNQTADLKKYADALEEIAALRSEVQRIRKDDGEQFPEAHNEVEISYEIFDTRNRSSRIIDHGTSTNEFCGLTTSWGAIFVSIAEQILLKSDVQDSSVKNLLNQLAPTQPEGRRAQCDDKFIQEIKSLMFARNLFSFETVTRESNVSGSYTRRVWHLTENGRIWYRKLRHESVFA